ncbi:MAG: 4-(cytidine 5'-diphospho)-2-C-methyl-D-erythritol kinase [Firmicutes bacterium]|nr:4-(cytidine 5'-diphospho)-2-C-methyl-D-erythritol kinase [Bacillota bacterium]MBV1728012.1 4-(cytidine 5'-diphospho)-2-C-methyl-D-erythritol kinase [Desulforudis sp.]MDZ7609598.1 4-(cytidine 5'-diphospho)-2-C-methyl-D-erythritol kinase [Eubacteriales bacterium]MBU4532947.1 4-(cytidine 5'-diphospho)-2-C-methyl-D-erythritol kinase [Bacillota bacterium]MBU4553946.1 4-(cytidine 5'-diphospho)-2-C-methyl-D-erythritol kinase [Bacillota bacterium]
MLAVKAYAKINLTLSVGRKRLDGYHELESVMQQLALHDLLEFVISEEDISLTTENTQVPAGSDNLIVRAAELLRRHTGCLWGARIHLTKNIPVAAGLGGGSADAAATLIGLNSLWGLGLSMDKLMEWGARLGSDVPFCLFGGTALARGRGEVLERLPEAPPMGVVLVKPAFSVSTAGAYRMFDDLPEPEAFDAQKMVEGLRDGGIEQIAEALHNDLERATFTMHPELQLIKDDLWKAGASGILMAGSGPTIFGLAPSTDEAQEIADRLLSTEVGVWVTSTAAI